MAIVKNIAELHGGRVSVYSEGLGKGSEFFILLPIINDTTIPVKDNLSDNRQQDCYKIVVIDDNRDFSDIICSLLMELGHQVEFALRISPEVIEKFKNQTESLKASTAEAILALEDFGEKMIDSDFHQNKKHKGHERPYKYHR